MFKIALPQVTENFKKVYVKTIFSEWYMSCYAYSKCICTAKGSVQELSVQIWLLCFLNYFKTPALSDLYVSSFTLLPLEVCKISHSSKQAIKTFTWCHNYVFSQCKCLMYGVQPQGNASICSLPTGTRKQRQPTLPSVHNLNMTPYINRELGSF